MAWQDVESHKAADLLAEMKRKGANAFVARSLKTNDKIELAVGIINDRVMQASTVLHHLMISNSYWTHEYKIYWAKISSE